MAGALGVRLGGTNVYLSGAEQRPRLGHGRVTEPADVRRAATLSGSVGAFSLASAVAVAALLGRRR